MAAFEVDHLLREAGMGEEVTLQLLYNPTGTTPLLLACMDGVYGGMAFTLVPHPSPCSN